MKAKLSLLLFSSLLMCSCGDDVLENIIPSVDISLSATEKAIDAGSGTTEIEIMANCAWTASSNASWLSVSPSTGSGDAVLNCSWVPNPETKERKATITVKSDNVKRTVTFIQSASSNDNDKPKVLSCFGVVGNLIENEDSYFEITFDQPITVTGLYMAQYVINHEPEYSNDFKTIRYTFNAAKLGLDLACQVQVRNYNGGVYNIDVTIPFYQKKYPVEGSLKYALLSEDKQSVWVTTCEPNKLLQLSLDDGHVMHDVDIPFVPRYICYNSYNNRIYVLPQNANYDYSDYLCVVNPLNGSIEETITFEPAPDAHPQYPTIYPYELQFTNDGFGIVLLHARSTTQREWRYLDSANHHNQKLSGYSWADKTFEHVYRSYDGNSIWANIYPGNYTKIYNMSRNHSAPKEYQIHPKFQSDEYYAGGSMMDMQFSPFSNKVFISAAPGSECVVNLDTDSYSKVILAEARDSEAGWDLASNSRSLVYHVCGTDNLFLLLDMDKGEPIFFNYHIWFFKPCNVYHIPNTDQLMIAAGGGLYFFDASAMKQ